MKGISILLLFVVCIIGVATAQTMPISGTVKTADGDALYRAFIQDKQYKYGAYTDSLGSFSLGVNPDSKIKVSCSGFRDTVINVDGKTVFTIVLRPLVNIVANRSNIPPADDRNAINMVDFRESINYNVPSFNDARPATPNSATAQIEQLHPQRPPGPINLTSGFYDMAQGAIFPVFIHKEATQGSRYLFNEWVHGYVINSHDSTIQSPTLFFNYDKIGGSLLLSRDKRAAIEIFRESAKSFTLFDATNQPFTFTIVPDIDKGHYVQVIASGNNYNIYKAIKTKFVQANYTTDGIASSGNNFDLYEDESTYYVLNVKTNQLQKITLRKKMLKQAFAPDAPRLEAYFKQNDADIDDSYLAALGGYMNM